MEIVQTVGVAESKAAASAICAGPCILVVFGASGDLTKRLLMPALYNLACDGLLPRQFAIVGFAMEALTTDAFRERMTRDVQSFNTRPTFDPAVWDSLAARLFYTPGKFDDAAAFGRLLEQVRQLEAEYRTGGNVLFYFATPPSCFGLISEQLAKAGVAQFPGWKRIIVEKPFGVDLPSAKELNRQILGYWDESQVYRVDHYLGKETVQNLLAFRFANGMFEPLWNKEHIDHIQFSVAESVSVEGRGGYYDRAGVLRDMIQNHMLQMLAYVCMEPPISFEADDIRNEKAKALKAVRVWTADEALRNTVRGQYGAGKKASGAECPAYRQEPDVNAQSKTETFAALRLFIDNLALGRSAHLSAFGQGAVEARHRSGGAIQESSARALPGDRRGKAVRESTDLSHSTGSGDRIFFPGQDAWPRDAASAGQHALQLWRCVSRLARHGLRGDAV